MASTIKENLSVLAKAKSNLVDAFQTLGISVPSKFVDYGAALQGGVSAAARGPFVVDDTVSSWPGCVISFKMPDFVTQVSTERSDTGLTVFPLAVYGDQLDLNNVQAITGAATFTGCHCATVKGLQVTRIDSISPFVFAPVQTVRFPLLSESGITYNSTNSGGLFEQASYLKSVTLGSFNTLPPRFFAGCSSLKEVIFSGGTLSQINERAFAWCSALESFPASSTVTQIGTNAFTDCVALEYVDILNDQPVALLGPGIFYGCTGLRWVSAYIDGSIPSTTFARCTGLESVDVGGNITEIGAYAFAHCTALKEVTLGCESVPSVTEDVVIEWSVNGTSIKVPPSLYSAFLSSTYWTRIRSQISVYDE